jgi:tripeptide aminopeptidase
LEWINFPNIFELCREEEMNEDLVKNFFKMVKINSESGEEKGVISYLKNLFTKELQAKCIIDDYGNLIVNILPKNSSCIEHVFFSAHADTVKPGKNIEPVIEDGIIRSKGDTILGADDKAGIAELVEAIRTAKQYPPLEIIISVEEEIGLVGAKHVDVSNLKSKRGFLIDMDALDTIVVGGPSHMLIDIKIIGKAAHAGMEPEKGISAIKAAAHAISILKEGRIDEETTVNVGIIEGGEIRNGVPEMTTIKAECRSLNHKKCIRQSELIKEIFEVSAESIGACAEVKMDMAYEAVKIPENVEVVKVAKEAVESVGLEPKIKIITGGTDASIYNKKGIQTVVIGMGAKEEHTKDENISVADMKKAVKIIQYIFKELSKKR